jgi:predicted DNA-binding transcriptional regulator AlpA
VRRVFPLGGFAPLTGPQLKNQPSTTVKKGGGPKQKLLFRKELCDFFQISAVTLWTWQQRYGFPRAIIVCGKSAWIQNEVDDWIAKRPRRKLKCDTEQREVTEK